MDLKALENGQTRFAIDMQDLKDLRQHLADGQRGGQAPALREHRDLEGSPTIKRAPMHRAPCLLWGQVVRVLRFRDAFFFHLDRHWQIR